MAHHQDFPAHLLFDSAVVVGIGGEAIQHLTRLLDQESDVDLKLRIQQVLHALSQGEDPEDAKGGDHGQAG